jgi:hypothetical protein
MIAVLIGTRQDSYLMVDPSFINVRAVARASVGEIWSSPPCDLTG